MGEVTYKEFITSINEIDAFLYGVTSKIASIDARYQVEIDNINKEKDASVQDIIKGRTLIFEDLYLKIKDHPMIAFANNLKTTALIFPTYQGYSPFSASNINEALMKLNIYINGFKEVKIKLEKYEFNTGLEFHFSGEHLFIDDRTYEAPDFPELSLKDFDTSNEKYKALILEASSCLEVMKNALEYIIAYYKSEAYIDSVKETADKLVQDELKDIISRKDAETESLYETLNYNYDELIAPTLLSYKEKARDYINMSRLKMGDEYKEKINIGAFTCSFAHYDSFIPIVKGIDKLNVVDRNVKCPCELDLTNRGNVLINANRMDRSIIDFLYQLVLQFITSAPLKKVHLALVDVDRIDEFDFVYQFNKEYLKSNNLLFTGKIACDGEEFKNMLSLLEEKIDEIKANKLSPNDCRNIFEYNKIASDPQELYLVVFANSPKCLNKEIMDKILNVVVNGPMCGIFSLILSNSKTVLSHGLNRNDDYNEFINIIPSKSVVINYQDGKYEIDGNPFMPNYAFVEDSISRFFKDLLGMCEGK